MELTLPRQTMYDGELMRYVHILSIPDFRGVKMRDELPAKPLDEECGILNFNTHLQQGSHWICWYKKQNDRYYFDSFGEPPPLEMLRYLKTDAELKSNSPVIKRSAVTVQHDAANECGSLCLYMLKMLTNDAPFSHVLEILMERYEKLPTPPLTIRV